MAERKPRCNPEDLVGKVYEKNGLSFTVVAVKGRRAEAHNQLEYLCRCSCGNEFVAARDYLRRKNPPSGCYRCAMSNARHDKPPIEERCKLYIGKRYGHLVVESVVKTNTTQVGNCLFRFKCDCGGHVDALQKKISSWSALGKPHCKNCISTRDGLVKAGTKQIVFDKIQGKKDDLNNYSNKDPFEHRRKCTAECNVCALRQFNCCHDCNMFSDCTKCYKHCRENPDTCGYCIGGKRD